MTKKIIKQKELPPIIKKPKKRKAKPKEFMAIMQRLELIDQEIKQEEKLFDIKITSLELEKQYLWNIIQPK